MFSWIEYDFKSMKKQILLGIFSTFIFANALHAAQIKSEVHPNWRAFGGTALGFGLVNGSGYQGASRGPQYSLNALMSYQQAKWALDFGASWLYEKIEG